MTSITYSNKCGIQAQECFDLVISSWWVISMCSEICIIYFVVCALKVCVHYQDGDVRFLKIIRAFSLL